MDDLTYEVYLTLSGRLLLNKMLAGDKLVLTRAVGSSMTTESPENLLYITPEKHFARQFMAVANGDYTELTMVFLSSDAIEDYTLNTIGIYGKIDGQADDILLYVCVCNAPFTIHKNLSLEFVFKIQEALTKGELTVEINSNYACPISHLSDNYRHIFIQTNTSTSEATVSSGTENTFLNGQPFLFIPRVNLTTSAKINIAGQKYNLKYKNIAGNFVTGTFIANRTYCLSYESSTNSFVYSEIQKVDVQNGNLKFWNGSTWKTAMVEEDFNLNLKVQNGILHYYSGGAWHSTMPAGMINAFANTSTPTGYLLCNGWEYNKNSYPELFAAIGYTYGGSGDTFKVPNLSGKTIIGVNGSHTLGSTGGSETASISVSNMPNHNHSINITNLKYKRHKYDNVDSINSTLPSPYGSNSGWVNVAPTTGTLVAEPKDFQGAFGLLAYQYADMLVEKTTSWNGNTGAKGSGDSLNIMNPYMAINYYISTGRSLL